jgi:hypothetical protein
MTDVDMLLAKRVTMSMTPPEPIDKWFDSLAGKNQQRSMSEIIKMGPQLAREGRQLEDSDINVGRPTEIPIQFPPKIKSNSKAAKWYTDHQASYEPVAVWLGADATKLQVELKYVVTGGPWNIENISKAVHTIMGYFYRDIRAGERGAPVIRIAIYETAPETSEISTWRLENASVIHGDEIVVEGDKAYHQVSTVTMNLAMITRIGDKQGQFSKHQIDIIPEKPKKEWY